MFTDTDDSNGTGQPTAWGPKYEQAVEPGTDVAGAFVAVACVVGFLCFIGWVMWTEGTWLVDNRAASAAETSR